MSSSGKLVKLIKNVRYWKGAESHSAYAEPVQIFNDKCKSLQISPLPFRMLNELKTDKASLKAERDRDVHDKKESNQLRWYVTILGKYERAVHTSIR